MEIHCKYDEMADVDLLVPHPRNANTHPEGQIKMLAKILDHTGWRHPIVVSKLSGFIVAGHGRLKAARVNGYGQVPVVKQDFENEAEEFQFLIADNKIADLAKHDDNLMIEGIKDLDLVDSDFDLMGLDDFNIVDLSDTFDEPEDVTDSEKKFVLEITFPNDMEMMDIHDDLTARGYIVKVK